jgi:hypothetical protein
MFLRARDGGRDEIRLYRVRMDAVVDLRKFPFRRPTNQLLFLRLKPLEFLYKVQLKFNR